MLRGQDQQRHRRRHDHRDDRHPSPSLAAVTLRIYLPLVMILDLPFLPSYRAISFLAWVPNLMLAELWLRRRPQIGQA